MEACRRASCTGDNEGKGCNWGYDALVWLELYMVFVLEGTYPKVVSPVVVVLSANSVRFPGTLELRRSIDGG